jgi:hypothetical protein
MAGHAVTPATTPRVFAPALRSVAREGRRERARASPRRASASAQATTSSSSPGLREAKRALLEACEGTFRGSAASASERAAVEEAQVALEGFTYKSDADPDLDLEALAGRWRLRWTNANDVLSVLRLARDSLGAVQVGDIFQTFDARGSLTNEIRLGLAFLTQSAARDTEGGLALKVGARYERVDAGASGEKTTTKNDDAKKKPSPSRRTLALVFEEAKVTELRISDELELVFAPALLPRGAVNHRLLLALREAEARFDLSSAVAIGAPSSSSAASGKKTGAPVGAYHVTYLDEDTLIGRANGAGGTFIFDRVA